MTTLPDQYKWLNTVDVPNTIKYALQLFGTDEVSGTVNNKVILEWAKECNISNYTADSIPWCGLFVSVVVKRAMFEVVANPLWARNWSAFGTKSPLPSLGDVLVFSRENGSGHVGFYVAEDAEYFHVLGGNQRDTVCIIRIAKNRLLACRRPKWKISKPNSVKPYHVDPNGIVSTNEN